jgi:hypothetical protein
MVSSPESLGKMRCAGETNAQSALTAGEIHSALCTSNGTVSCEWLPLTVVAVMVIL